MTIYSKFCYPLVFLLFSLLLLRTPAIYAEQREIEDYVAARQLFWSKVYAKGGATLYCKRPFGPRKGRGINIEHVFPMSWVSYSLKCGKRWQCRQNSKRFNRIEADLHNLYPAVTHINDARGSYRFGKISGERRHFGACDFEIDESRRVVEPRPGARGEIARSMFYMHDGYGLYLKPKLGRLLLKWHFQDPPGKDEKRRNNIIETLQGTRNLYIDDPKLAKNLEF